MHREVLLACGQPIALLKDVFAKTQIALSQGRQIPVVSLTEPNQSVEQPICAVVEVSLRKVTPNDVEYYWQKKFIDQTGLFGAMSAELQGHLVQSITLTPGSSNGILRVTARKATSIEMLGLSSGINTALLER